MVLRLILIPCLVSLPLAPAASAAERLKDMPRTADECQRGLEDAQLDAETVGQGNFWGGFGLGLLLGPFGALGAPLLAGPDEPKYLLASGESDKYKNCYHSTYLTATKYRKKNKALIGGIVGFAVLAVVVAAAKNDKN